MNIIDNLRKPMNKKNQIRLNKILKCKTMNEETKEKCFKILLYLINNRGSIINWDLILDRFTLFCTDKKINQRKCFKSVIDSIYKEINIQVEKRDILLLKVSSVIKSFNFNSNDLELENYVSRLMESNLSYQNYELINIVSDKPIKNTNKRNILFNTLLVEEVSAFAEYGRNYERVLNVLNNKKTLKLDNEYYEKFVKLVISYVHSLTFESILDNKRMSIKKLEISIDYLLRLMEKYREDYNQYRLVCEEVVNDMKKQPVFIALRSPDTLKLSNNEFKQTLDEIINSKYPNAYALFMALGGRGLSKEKYDIACDYINDGKEETEDKLDSDKRKFNVVDAATGPVMKNVSVDTYKLILYLIGSDIKEQQEVFCDFNDNLVSLVHHGELFANNEGRLLFVINKIINNPEKAKYILLFANNRNTRFYSDSEYVKAMNIIINTPEYTEDEYTKFVSVDVSNINNRVIAIIELFTNDNLEFTYDKKFLFDFANSNTQRIKSFTKDLNKLGYQNSSVKRVFDGISDDTYRRVIGKTRKLSQ